MELRLSMQSSSRRFGMSGYALCAFQIAAALAKKLRNTAPTAIVLDLCLIDSGLEKVVLIRE
jgi:hypothetical protein